MTEVGFGLGSNVGDRTATLARALTKLFGGAGLAFVTASSFYETEPWGFEDQNGFINLCAVGRTTLPARQLLARCKDIERALGRRETFRWGPRIIDIDILYYDKKEVVEADLAIPHRELFNRAFVLKPLAEIRPDLVLSGRRIASAAARFQDEPMPVVAPPWRPQPA